MQLQDIWTEADALLATPPPKRPTATAMAGDIALPSVWDEADAILSTPPVKPARPLTPAGAGRGTPPLDPLGMTPDEATLVDRTRTSQAALPPPPVPPRPPAPETPTTPGFFNPKTGVQVRTPALFDSPLDTPLEGVVQTAAGLGGVARAAMAPTGPPVPGRPSVVNPKTGSIHQVANVDPATIQAGNDLAEGVMKAATPLIVGAAVAQPMATAVALVQASLVAQVGQQAAAAAGATPEVQTLVGNVAAVLSGSLSVAQARDAVLQSARAVALAGKLSGEALPSEIRTAGGNIVRPGYHAPIELLDRGTASTTTPSNLGAAPPETWRDIIDTIRAPEAAAETSAGPIASASLTPETRAEMDRVLQEPPHAVETRQQPSGNLTEHPGDGGQRPPAAAVGGGGAEQRSSTAVVEPPAGPVAPGGPTPIAPDTLTEIDRVLGTPQTSAPTERRMEAPDAGIREEPPAVAPAGPLAPGGVEERVDVAGGGAQPEGGRPPGGRPRPSTARAAADARAAEAEGLDTLVAAAQAEGHTGDATALRTELADRLQLIKDLDAEFHETGRDPERLLRDIARLGGLSVGAETGLKGELRWLKEFQDNIGGTAVHPRTQFGQVRGVQGVFNERGLSVDDMLTQLQQEPRYAHLDDLSTFLEEIRAAATADRPATAIDRLRAGLGERWWETIGTATPSAEDTLDTGETQTRLPGAEPARQVGQADTSFRAPVQATSDDFAQDFLGENDVPIEVEGDLFNDEPGSQGMPRREGPPVPERPAPSRGFFGKQELPANRPTTLPSRRFGVMKIRPLPVAEIVGKLTDLFGGVPVNTGRLYGGYLGVYQSDKESIRVQVADDLHVIAHEMGHHLDMAIMEGSVVFNRGPIAKELKALGAPTSMPSYTPAQQRREGTAEFFRRWLTDETDTPRVGTGVGQTLAQEAPRFTAAFEQYLDRHPKIAKGLREIRNDVARYLALPAEEQARLHIDFEGGGRQILKQASALFKAATTPEGRRRATAYLSSLWMDDLAAIRLMEEALDAGRPVDIAESAYAQARLARGHAAKAEGFLAFGVRDTDGTFIGRSFDSAIAPVYDRLEDFALYAAGRRAGTMHRRGKESGFTASQIAATIAKYQSPEFDQALAGLREFHTAMLDYMVEGGVLSPASRAHLLKVEPDYIPYQRILDGVSEVLTGKKIANRSTPVKRLKGSGRRLANPLETVIRNTHQTVSTVEQNRAMGNLVRKALKTQGHGQWLEEIPAPKVATRFKLNQLTGQIRTLLEDNGVEFPEGGLGLDEMLDELATVFTPRQFARGNEQIVTWLDGGTLRWFEIHDQDLYEALTAIGPRGVEGVMTVFQLSAGVLRKMATSTVGFLIRNPARDQLTAMVQSRSNYRPGLDWIKGLFHYVGKDAVYQLYVNSLADQATFASPNRDLLRKRLHELGEGPLRKLLDHTLLGPFDGLSALSHAGESATRIGEFARTLDNADFWEPGLSAADKRTMLTQGALNARDVSQDFQRKGRYSRQWDNYSAFFAARVGGYGRMWEAFEENPTRFMWKALTLSLVSVLLWQLNHDDDEYNELPGWERNYYWHIPLSMVGGTGFVKVPKPFELGQIFGTGPELALEMLSKDDPAIANRLPDKTTATQMFQQLFMTAVLPVMEVFANYDYFRDRTIVNPWQEGLAAPLQYNRWTSETSKALGELLDVSPAKVDTLIYGYTAGVGQGVLEYGLDPLLGASHRPAGGPGRWPAIGTLYRPNATAEAESLTEFFTARDALAGLKASVKQYRDMGREDRAQALVAKNRRLAPFEAGIPAAERQLKDLRDGINQVFASKTLLPEEKRQALDALYLQMIQIARTALGKKPLARKPPVPDRPSAATRP